MSDRELLKVVTGFRKGILGKRKSDLQCLVVCAPLQGYLSMFGIETELIDMRCDSGNHVYLKMQDGRIIDPTADQFYTPTWAEMPPVYIGELPDWYQIETLLRHSRMFCKKPVLA